MTLLDNDRQVHSLVDLTKDVIAPRGSKRSDLNAATIDLYVVDSRCAWLVSGFGDAVLPGTTGKALCAKPAKNLSGRRRRPCSGTILSVERVESIAPTATKIFSEPRSGEEYEQKGS